MSEFDHDPIWTAIRGLRQEIRELRGQLDITNESVRALERQTPQARQAEYEADLAAADLAASGYDDDRPAPVNADRHGAGCQCPWCYDEPDDYDSGPECDDQGGMSEYRTVVTDGGEPS
jgi:hypothetical protein